MRGPRNASLTTMPRRGISPDTVRNMAADPFIEIKRQVLIRLRPRPLGSWPEVEQKVRQALQEVLAGADIPLTAADRARVAREVCEVLGD